MILPGKYCNSLTAYSRFHTREVYIGDIPLGGDNPIRIQSMTTTHTMDTKATVAQTIRMVEAGCEYVRITAPSIKEAENLEIIKKELLHRGYKVPLIADIHFTPNAAEAAARIVEKVRVNPGNFADKKRFQTIEYTPEAYQEELTRIRKRFEPLVRICKEYGTAMRIGTNHGSLSDRIMSWYGDTPRGMVESAMEFMRICADLDYHELVISMKASNPQVMVQAYRLLVETMVAEGMNYPLHLGVTEAGDGEDGRIKSAVGIGTLLEDGLGDTIRVSLTEEPELEVPVARELADRYRSRAEKIAPPGHPEPAFPAAFNPYEYDKRPSAELNTFIGGNQVPRVVLDILAAHLKDPAVLAAAGYIYSPLLDKYHMGEQSVDFVYLGNELPSFSMPGNLKQLYNYSTWLTLSDKTNCHPLLTLEEFVTTGEAGVSHGKRDAALNLVQITLNDLDTELFAGLIPDPTLVFVLEISSSAGGPADESAIHGMAQQRAFFFRLMELSLDMPVIIRRSYFPEIPAGHPEALQPGDPEASQHGDGDPMSLFQLYAATDAGALLVDGLGDGLWLDAPHLPHEAIVSTTFGILQATRSRISRTEYISCPSCGRTLFDLQETTQLIRSRTSHLKGIKIGIMGCIVNGPGEMADADYGYVGTGPGKITLYRGKEVVRKNVNTENAVDELIEVIKEDDNWVESR